MANLGESPRMIWWKCEDLVNHYRKVGFSDEAIQEARLTGKRVEFHMADRKLYVKRSGVEAADEDDGENFAHFCPPKCNGEE